MEGHALDNCCEQLDIRLSTARMHVANMFAKAGVQRQGQLISLLLKSVGLVRVKSDESSPSYAASQYRLAEIFTPHSSTLVEKQQTNSSRLVLLRSQKTNSFSLMTNTLRPDDTKFL